MFLRAQKAGLQMWCDLKLLPFLCVPKTSSECDAALESPKLAG
jgi:hypothetical protein